MNTVLGKFRMKMSFETVFAGILFGVALTLSLSSAVNAGEGLDGRSSTGHRRGIVEGPIQENPTAVMKFWSLSKMKEAEDSRPGPSNPPPEDPLLDGANSYGYVLMPKPYTSHAISRINGMLFYREPGGHATHCSASVITSTSKSLVLTAAHCVYRADGWREMMLFVPAYNGSVIDRETVPLGKWVVKQAFIPALGAGFTSEDDVAVLAIYPHIGPDHTVEQAVGGGFKTLVTEDGSFSLVELVGYPGTYSDHKGEQRYCVSPAIPAPQQETTALTLRHCSAVSGNSGGPILISRGLTEPHVVGVVHSYTEYSRLLPSTFQPIYEAADETMRP